MSGRIVLGKTPEDLEVEKAEKLREQEAKIQEAVLERQKKIQALHKQQKKNKIIIFSMAGVVVITLLVFGTYNTFIKQGLTLNDVNTAINQSKYNEIFPTEGLDNYIRDNCSALFNKYVQIDNKKGGKNIQSVEVDPNSCYIFKVRKLSPTVAQVYFAVDVITTEKDTVVTDPVLIEQLKRSGFSVDTSKSTNTASTDTTTTDSTTEEGTNESDANESDTKEVSMTIGGETKTSETDTTDETSSEKANTEDTATEDTSSDTSSTEDIPMTSVEYSVDSTGNTDHYYMTGNGAVVKSGKVTTQRYYFYLPVELVYTYDNDQAVTAGYAAAGNMNLYSLVETDQTDFTDINTNSLFAFDEKAILDEDTSNKMRVKVDNTLKSLYEGSDTSQDFLNYRKFNSYDGNYLGINEFYAYSTPNQMGYNVYVTYTIVTPQGFNYTLDTYMNVEKNGSTWVIKGIM